MSVSSSSVSSSSSSSSKAMPVSKDCVTATRDFIAGCKLTTPIDTLRQRVDDLRAATITQLHWDWWIPFNSSSTLPQGPHKRWVYVLQNGEEIDREELLGSFHEDHCHFDEYGNMFHGSVTPATSVNPGPRLVLERLFDHIIQTTPKGAEIPSSLGPAHLITTVRNSIFSFSELQLSAMRGAGYTVPTPVSVDQTDPKFAVIIPNIFQNKSQLVVTL